MTNEKTRVEKAKVTIHKADLYWCLHAYRLPYLEILLEPLFPTCSSIGGIEVNPAAIVRSCLSRRDEWEIPPKSTWPEWRSAPLDQSREILKRIDAPKVHVGTVRKDGRECQIVFSEFIEPMPCGDWKDGYGAFLVQLCSVWILPLDVAGPLPDCTVHPSSAVLMGADQETCCTPLLHPAHEFHPSSMIEYRCQMTEFIDRLPDQIERESEPAIVVRLPAVDLDTTTESAGAAVTCRWPVLSDRGMTTTGMTH